MKISTAKRWGRQVWDLDNGAVTLTVMPGGGHIAGVRVNAGPAVNPLWNPIWKSIEPGQYRSSDDRKYAAKLLATIFGHNLCLGHFGEPSDEERKAGLGSHGEAPVARWRIIKRRITGRSLTFVYGCTMPIAGMRLTRTITSRKDSAIFNVREAITSTVRRDQPFTICEHVTFGPPFLQPEVTLFDMPATRGNSFPDVFGPVQRMKENATFEWPKGPGVNGAIDLRTIRKAKNSDFSTQIIDPRRDAAWFSAVNPKMGLLVAYSWKRTDYPWVGNWEENGARKTVPWNGKSLTRGMEFSNAAFPEGIRASVNRGQLFGVPTFAWLPALGTINMDFSIIARCVPKNCRGVSDIRATANGYDIDLLT